MIGYGTVGRGVAGLLRDHAALYTVRTGQAVRLGRVLVRDVAKARAAAQAAGDPTRWMAGSAMRWGPAGTW